MNMVNITVPANCLDAINEVIDKANKKAEREEAVLTLFNEPMNRLLDQYGFFTVPMLIAKAKDLGLNVNNPAIPGYINFSPNDVHAALKKIADIRSVRCSPKSDGSMKIYYSDARSRLI